MCLYFCYFCLSLITCIYVEKTRYLCIENVLERLSKKHGGISVKQVKKCQPLKYQQGRRSCWSRSHSVALACPRTLMFWYVFIKYFVLFNHWQTGSVKKSSIVFLIVDRRYNRCTKQLWFMGWWWLWKMDWIHSRCWSHCWWRGKIWWTRRSLVESLQCMSTFWSIKFS